MVITVDAIGLYVLIMLLKHCVQILNTITGHGDYRQEMNLPVLHPIQST